MIASISGPVLATGASWFVIGVGGLGMRVEVAAGTVSQHLPGDEIMLHTSLVVREDSLTLYGFASAAELEVFGYLIAVSGVGPRSALGVLSELTPAEIVGAVAAEDARVFQRVSGIGPKTAKLLVVALSGKLSHLSLGEEPLVAPVAAVEPEHADADAVREGLMGLGWGESEASAAVRDAVAAGVATDRSALLRASLALLQSARTASRGSAAKR